MPEILTPMKAIRAKCLDCMCGQAQEVRLCPITDCSLYPYRMGHNPNRAGIRSKSAFQPRENGREGDAECGYTTMGDGEKSYAEMGESE